MCGHQNIFPDIFSFKDLPYFELKSQNLISDPQIGPIIDVHTHLALSMTPKSTVDLMKETAVTEHYLPLEKPIDLGIYVNKNFEKKDLLSMKKDLILKSLRGGGKRETHTAPNLLREMKDLGVAYSTLLPIDIPVVSRNSDNFLDIAKNIPELISFCSIHPFDPCDKFERVFYYQAKGAKGLKYHPTVQMIPPDHPKAFDIYRACGAMNMPVIWHCGPVEIEPKLGRIFSQLKNYWKPVKEFPETTFILGHSGCLQMEYALELAKTYPNVWLEISCQSVQNVKKILKVIKGATKTFLNMNPTTFQ